MARDWKAEAENKRQDEIAAGQLRVALYGKLEKIEKATDKLKSTFPSLDITTVLNKPYSHVTLRVQPQVKLAPLDSPAVLLDEEPTTYVPMVLTDLVDEYPSDHLVTQLALIA